MDAPLVIRFTPDRKDYIRASRTLAMKSMGFIIIGSILVFLMIAAAVVLIVPGLVSPIFRNVAFVVLLIGAFNILYFLVVIPWQLSRTYKSNDFLQKSRMFTFSESGVAMDVGGRTSNLLWDNFEHVIDSAEFYLLIYKGENRVYPFIPKRAFSTEASEDAFRAAMEEKGIPIK